MNLAEELRDILDNWSSIKKDMPANVVKTYESGKDDWEFVLNEMPEEVDSLESVPEFVKQVNKNRKKADNRKPYEPAVYSYKQIEAKSRGKKDRKKKVETPAAEAAQAPAPETVTQVSASEAKAADIHLIPYGKGYLLYGSGTKDIKDELTKMGGFWCSGTKNGRKLKKTKDLPAGVKSGWTFLAEDKDKLEKLLNREKQYGKDIEVTYKGKHYILKPSAKFKFAKQKTSRRGIIKRKKMLELPPYIPETVEEEPKKKKSSKGKSETKTKRVPKPKYGESPNWYKTMRTFVEAAGRTIPVRSVRKMLVDLQDRFDARRGLTTPHIAVLREIQNAIVPYANKKTEKVKLPAWKSIVTKAKNAMRTINVDGKAGYNDITASELAGVRGGFWLLDYKLSDADKPFRTLAEAKEYVKEHSINEIKKMTRQHCFLYYTDTHGEVTRVCNFNVKNGKVVFKPTEEY